MQQDTTILIVCFNEQERIGPCLDSLLKQSCLSRVDQILVIDNGSTDNTLQEIQKKTELKNGNLIQLHRAPHNHMGASRAMGVQMAKTPFIAFIDGDCIAPSNWLETLMHHFEKEKINHPKMGGVCGPNRLPKAWIFSRTVNLMLSSFIGHGFSPQAMKPEVPQPTDHLPTTNCLYWRDAILEAENFSLEIARYGEDVDLGHRVKELGYELFLYPDPVVLNHCAFNSWQWFKRMYNFGRAQRAVGWKHLLAIGLFACVLIKPLHIVGLMYLLLVLNVSIWASAKNEEKGLFPFVAFMSIGTHFSYSLGLLRSVFDRYLFGTESLAKSLLSAGSKPEQGQQLPLNQARSRLKHGRQKLTIAPKIHAKSQREGNNSKRSAL